MNKFICVCRITTDLELKKVGEQVVLNFQIAVPRKKGNYKGQDTDFFYVTAWGKLSEVMETYLKKGSKILLEGKLHCEPYESETGTRYKTYILAETFEFLDKKEKEVDVNEESNIM